MHPLLVLIAILAIGSGQYQFRSTIGSSVAK
jgi:hypothetical protein